MTRSATLALAVAAVLAAAPALAQTGSGRYVRVEVNPYAGGFLFDDSGLEASGLEANVAAIAGGRLGVAVGDDWLFEGSYGWSSVTLETSEFEDFPDPSFETDLTVHLLSGSVAYLIETDVAPTTLALMAGAGGMWVDPEFGESDADFMVDLGLGFTHPVNDWIAFKGDFRDHVTFCAAAESAEEIFSSACAEDETLHHFELSGGLQFYFY